MEHSQIFSNVYIAFRVDQIYLVVANARKLLSKTRKHTEQPPFWKLANTQSSHFLKTCKHTKLPLFENSQTHRAATSDKMQENLQRFENPAAVLTTAVGQELSCVPVAADLWTLGLFALNPSKSSCFPNQRNRWGGWREQAGPTYGVGVRTKLDLRQQRAHSAPLPWTLPGAGHAWNQAFDRNFRMNGEILDGKVI